MTRSAFVVALFAGLLLLPASQALSQEKKKKKETVDDRIRRMEGAGEIAVITREHTRDACSKVCAVTFTSTTDGDVVVMPGETKYFKIDKKDDYTRSGGYYWRCCDSPERSRIKGATYIKVVRNADTGAFDQYWVELELK